MIRYLVDTILSSLLSLGHQKMMLYAEGTCTTVNIMKMVLCQGGVLVVMEILIFSLTLADFLEKLTKGIETRLS